MVKPIDIAAGNAVPPEEVSCYAYLYGGHKFLKATELPDEEEETRLYLGGAEFVNGQPESYYHGEGRVALTGDKPAFQYKLTDHLGNTMVLFEDKDNDKIITTESNPAENEVLQRNFYYAFGLPMQGPWNHAPADPDMPYLYNGKELEGELGLGWYAYGFRYYDSSVGRFVGVDPLAGEMPDWSPFGYAYSNPISFIDFMGLAPEEPPTEAGTHEGQTHYDADTGATYEWDGVDTWHSDMGGVNELEGPTVTAPSSNSGGASWKVNGQSMSQREVFDLIDRRPSLQSIILSGGFDTEYNQPIATAYMKHDVQRAITEFNSNFALVLMTVTPIGESAGVLLGGYSRLAGSAAKSSTKAFTYTKSAGKHLTEVVKRGPNAGQLSRPYMNSPLTIREIMATGKGIPDATFKGGMNWRVPGTFRGSQGTWELGINPKTNVIYHFNFVH